MPRIYTVNPKNRNDLHSTAIVHQNTHFPSTCRPHCWWACKKDLQQTIKCFFSCGQWFSTEFPASRFSFSLSHHVRARNDHTCRVHLSSPSSWRRCSPSSNRYNVCRVSHANRWAFVFSRIFVPFAPFLTCVRALFLQRRKLNSLCRCSIFMCSVKVSAVRFCFGIFKNGKKLIAFSAICYGFVFFLQWDYQDESNLNYRFL